MVALLIITIVLLSAESLHAGDPDTCTYTPPAACETLPGNPCLMEYWDEMRQNGCYPYISAGNPLHVFGDNEPVEPYTSIPGDRLYRSGTLILHGESDTFNPGLEELVFLKGAGEYYEINAAPVIPDERIADMFSMLYHNGVNMVRLFTFSGNITRARDGWVYPFTWHPETAQFALHEYNPAFFYRLELFLDAAESCYINSYVPQPGRPAVTVEKNHKIFVLLNLFDASDDLGWEWDDSAWNCRNNDHGTHTPDDWKQMFAIFEPDGSLNALGRTQRDFVLKVVRSTRHHSNVIYEIINTPKLGDPEGLARWSDRVNRWIKEGLSGCDCDGAVHHLTAITEASIDDVTRAMLDVDGVDILGRHDACRGMNNRLQLIDEETPCEIRATAHLSLDMESGQFHADFYGSFAHENPKAILADTDGLHRILGGHHLAPYGRDFDENCRYWAHIAFVHGGHFNTKETLHYLENADEVDCETVLPEDAQCCYYKYGEKLVQPLSCSHCDDFFWEMAGLGEGNRFTGFDTGVAAAMNDLPLARRSFIRMAGYGPVPARPG
ncbi:MAG TPA: hypothetical protein PLV45_16920, partial [bacterium]|nr:hypothetical protein [bacterium]